MSDKLGKAEIQGEEAKRILNSDVFQAAFLMLEAKLINDFKNTGLLQKKKREDAWRKMNMLDELKSNLERLVRDAQAEKLKREHKSRSANLKGL